MIASKSISLMLFGQSYPNMGHFTCRSTHGAIAGAYSYKDCYPGRDKAYLQLWDAEECPKMTKTYQIS